MFKLEYSSLYQIKFDLNCTKVQGMQVSHIKLAIHAEIYTKMNQSAHKFQHNKHWKY